MAKKSRTPPPPRRKVQAPQRRTDPRTPGERRTFLYLAAFAASGVVILAVVLSVLAFATGGSSDVSDQGGVAAAMRSAGCTFRSYAVPKPKGGFGGRHVNSLDAKMDWVTDPPSGGPHYGTPAPFAFYDEAVNPRIIVHNLEHGAVAIWFGPDISSETRQELHDFYNSSPDGVVATPYAGLGTKIALAAWTGDPKRYGVTTGYAGEGHFSLCKKFDEGAFKTFRDVYRGHGPERIPLSSLKPGQ